MAEQNPLPKMKAQTTKERHALGYYVDLRVGTVTNRIASPYHAERQVARQYGVEAAAFARAACGEDSKSEES